MLIDSKALFSIIGSEMDWVEDKLRCVSDIRSILGRRILMITRALSSKFEFTNPNIKDACGCGESFNV